MGCPELEQLRAEAAQLRKELNEHRRQTVAHRTDERREEDRRFNDLDIYLRRRIQKKGAEIERHIVAHGCQKD